jgi:hypothetical protein
MNRLFATLLILPALASSEPIDLRDFGEGVRRQYAQCHVWRIDRAELLATCGPAVETPISGVPGAVASRVDRVVIFDGLRFVELFDCGIVTAAPLTVECPPATMFRSGFE